MTDTTIRTERLILHPMQAADAEDVHAYAGDPGIDMMLFLPMETYEETKAFAERSAAQWNTAVPMDREYVILLNGQIIGGVNLERCSREDTYEIGWIIRHDQQGRGYATEAAGALIAYAFDVLRAKRIQAHCDSRNSASEKVMLKLGMALIDRTGVREYPRTHRISGEYLYAIDR